LIFGLDPMLHSLCDLRELCEKYAVDPVFFISVGSSLCERAMLILFVLYFDSYRYQTMKILRIAMAQINPTVGDLTGNRDRIIDCINRAKKAEADIVAFPELALTGYPPEDLLLKPQFVKDNIRTLKEIQRAATGITAIVGFVDKKDLMYNAAAIMHNGKLAYVYHKILLPNYGVFDEYRYFRPGNRYPLITLKGVTLGVNICEDIWFSEGPTRSQALAGAEVIININASPYHKGKGKERLKMLTRRARENNVIVSYTNAVGGQDELVFDGQSMVIDGKGKLIASGNQFIEELLITDVRVPDRKTDGRRTRSQHFESIDRIVLSEKPASKKAPLTGRKIISSLPVCEEVYRALVLGTRDYVRKTGFRSAVIGLSGGIDSSLVAAVAADALGKDSSAPARAAKTPWNSRRTSE
jgi:NAD+ synthase (glutamine-hydrolysing)